MGGTLRSSRNCGGSKFGTQLKEVAGFSPFQNIGHRDRRAIGPQRLISSGAGVRKRGFQPSDRGFDDGPEYVPPVHRVQWPACTV